MVCSYCTIGSISKSRVIFSQSSAATETTTTFDKIYTILRVRVRYVTVRLNTGRNYYDSVMQNAPTTIQTLCESWR